MLGFEHLLHHQYLRNLEQNVGELTMTFQKHESILLHLQLLR